MIFNSSAARLFHPMGIPHGKSNRPIWALALAKSQVLEVHRALSPAPVPPCVLESNAYGENPAVAQVENGAVWSHG
jgi:hypothetical protein